MKQLCAGFFSILLLAFYFSGCASTNSQVVLTGTWGGEHIGMIVSDSSATLDYDCAHGSIDEPIKIDDNGMFNVIGVHIFEKGGPIRLGEIPDKHPAVYDGSINEKEMTLIVKLTDTEAVVDTFYLTLGAEPIIYKCY
ncbi:MAG: hypothetical protein JSW63_02725 [Ignavibacterium sp.]|nr:MAG: hypothetical protein JSW63_02725 [Ignavibacterium sp.]